MNHANWTMIVQGKWQAARQTEKAIKQSSRGILTAHSSAYCTNSFKCADKVENDGSCFEDDDW